MIALEVNGQFIDMPQGLSLSLSVTSPLFDLERIGRAYSFPFRIPVTPVNNKVFEHVHRMNSSNAQRRYPAKLYIGNMPTSMILFQTGYVVVQDRNESEIEISFQNTQIAWIDELKRTRLKDLTIPVTVPGAAYKPFVGLSVTNVEDPVGTETMYIEVNGNLYEALYPVPDAIIDGINADFPGLAYHYTDTGPKITIMLDPNAVETLLINLNPTITEPGVITVFFYPDTVETDREDDVKTAYLEYLDGVLDNPDTHAYPVLEAQDLYDGKNAQYIGYANFYDVDGQTYVLNDFDAEPLLGQTYKQKGWKNTLVPMPFLTAVLDAIFQYVGAQSVSGDFVEDQDLQKLLVFNTRTSDKLEHVSQFFVNSQYYSDVNTPYNAFQHQINLAQHLPDLTLYDFLMKLAGTFALTFGVEGIIGYVKTVESQLGQVAVDWTEKFSAAYTISPPEHDGYELDFDRQNEDELIAGQLERVAPAAQSIKPLKIVSPFFSLYSHPVNAGVEPFTWRWQVPYYNGVGASTPYEIAGKSPFMLLFYHGRQPNSNGFLYPLASAHNTNFEGDEVNAYSMNWDGPSGRFEKFWKRYVAYMSGETVTREAVLTLPDLLAWQKNPGRPVYLRHPKGNIKGIIREISVRVTDKGLGISKVTITKEP